jgi:hypothetical protein
MSTFSTLRRKAILSLAMLPALAAAQAPATGPKAEVVHWWTSGGESAAVKTLADAYRAAGGVWVDMAVALGEQARAVAINRIVGGNPPTAAQFNTSKQFLDIVDQGMLTPMDEVALRDGWDRFLPEIVRRGTREGPLLRGAGQHPHAHLALVFQVGAAGGRHGGRAQVDGRTLRRAGQAQGRRTGRPGARRPVVAGQHGLHRRAGQRGRARALPQGAARPGCSGHPVRRPSARCC